MMQTTICKDLVFNIKYLNTLIFKHCNFEDLNFKDSKCQKHYILRFLILKKFNFDYFKI